MSLACDFNRCKAWTVFAMLTPMGNGKATADVFVLTRDDVLVMTIMGVQFTKLPIARLEKMLDSASPKSNDKPIVKPIQRDFIASSSSSSSLGRSQDESEEDSLASPISSATTVDDETETRTDNSAVDKLKALIASYVGIAENNILDNSNIADLGVDSLAATELADEISNYFSKEIDGGELPTMTFGELCTLVAPQTAKRPAKTKKSSSSETVDDHVPETGPGQPSVDTKEQKLAEPPARPTLTMPDFSVVQADPIQVLRHSDPMFHSSADKLGFANYWTAVAPKQNELVLAYIGEEFKKLNLDLGTARPGTTLPSIDHLPKHAKVVQRLWDILADHGIVYNYESTKVRSSKPLPKTSSSTLLNEVNALFPSFANENRLMSVTAPHFADGLMGKTDHIGLLFGSQHGQDCLNDFYSNSPQLAVMTDHLLSFFNQLLGDTTLGGPLRILEVGGGFGGTTKRLAETLERLGQPVEYTFSDISSMLVKEARKKFARHSWMDFQSLNLEKDIPASLQGKYDIVIGTNVVHATSNIVTSTKRMRSLLRKGGFILLSEVTRIVDWYDLVYGLLDGWWAFKDCRTYPLQPVDDWVKDLKEAGFESVSYSRGDTEESNTQQLIIGSTKPSQVLPTSRPSNTRLNQSYSIKSMPYKVVDDTDILADVFFPDGQAPAEAMPIGRFIQVHEQGPSLTIFLALMIHGGGFMTLSKTAIRPYQTQLLLDNGYLPVSIDFRLCPEIDLISGPMTDVRDALGWVRGKLPAIAQAHGIKVDPKKVIAIGWSTGGHLAMTTAWTCEEIKQEPPTAILSFYGPTDFHSDGASFARMKIMTS